MTLRGERKVPQETLQERLETVRELRTSPLDSYALVKDRETGEHYLHYAYLHRDIASGGAEETYHQFMPIENDDVLAILFENKAFTYPDHWRSAFLRGGPEGYFVWFDPVVANDDDEAYAKLLMERLRALKEGGTFDRESIKRMLDETTEGEGSS